MNATIRKGKKRQKKLEFTSIKTGRCTAYGIIRDRYGNAFSIEIKGTDESEVRKFIKYEEMQAKQGKGIKVKVEPYEGKISYESLATKQTSRRVTKQTNWNGTSIRIKELRVKVKKPYKLYLEIDPELKGQDPPHDYPFDNQPEANVKFDVSFGTAKVELFEFTDPLKTQSVPVSLQADDPSFNGIMSAGNIVTFKNPSQFTQNWNFRVTPGPGGAIFTVGLDLVVM